MRVLFVFRWHLSRVALKVAEVVGRGSPRSGRSSDPEPVRAHLSRTLLKSTRESSARDIPRGSGAKGVGTGREEKKGQLQRSDTDVQICPRTTFNVIGMDSSNQNDPVSVGPACWVVETENAVSSWDRLIARWAQVRVEARSPSDLLPLYCLKNRRTAELAGRILTRFVFVGFPDLVSAQPGRRTMLGVAKSIASLTCPKLLISSWRTASKPDCM
jgi:hypothetical protein